MCWYSCSVETSDPSFCYYLNQSLVSPTFLSFRSVSITPLSLVGSSVERHYLHAQPHSSVLTHTRRSDLPEMRFIRHSLPCTLFSSSFFSSMLLRGPVSLDYSRTLPLMHIFIRFFFLYLTMQASANISMSARCV